MVPKNKRYMLIEHYSTGVGMLKIVKYYPSWIKAWFRAFILNLNEPYKRYGVRRREI